jgi:hypothetical protein
MTLDDLSTIITLPTYLPVLSFQADLQALHKDTQQFGDDPSRPRGQVPVMICQNLSLHSAGHHQCWPAGCTILRPSKPLASQAANCCLKRISLRAPSRTGGAGDFYRAQRAEAVLQDRCLGLFVPNVRQLQYSDQTKQHCRDKPHG